jgi:cysteine desulfurase
MTIYLDNHASTRCDPRVVDAMLPFLIDGFANPHSVTHAPGRAAGAAVHQAFAEIAQQLGGEADEWISTSGATESNNLALLGAALHPRNRRRHIITVATEHPAVLDPLTRLEQLHGFRITRLGVLDNHHPRAGLIDLEALSAVIDDDVLLISVMLANNEIGVVQPLPEIAALCRSAGCLLHTDATQAVGRLPIDVDQLDVDLLSWSAHKCYGPKGSGLLYVRRRGRRVRLLPLLEGGGQQRGLRSGTVNTAGLIGAASALKLCVAELASETSRAAELRQSLWDGLSRAIPAIELNGPAWGSSPTIRLPQNLNIRLPMVAGATLLEATPEIAASSGSACTSERPAPSHVLLALGLSEEQARCSLRFGVGRFTTGDDIHQAVEAIADSFQRLTSHAAVH